MPESLRRRADFWWKSMKGGGSAAVWIVGVVSLVTGITLAAILHFWIGFSALWAAIVALAAALLMQLEGSFRLWQDLDKRLAAANGSLMVADVTTLALYDETGDEPTLTQLELSVLFRNGSATPVRFDVERFEVDFADLHVDHDPSFRNKSVFAGDDAAWTIAPIPMTRERLLGGAYVTFTMIVTSTAGGPRFRWRTDQLQVRFRAEPDGGTGRDKFVARFFTDDGVWEPA